MSAKEFYEQIQKRNAETGAYITKQRQVLGYTQRQVAEMVGVSASTIGRWERGVHPIDHKKKATLFYVLNLNRSIPPKKVKAYKKSIWQRLFPFLFSYKVKSNKVKVKVWGR